MIRFGRYRPVEPYTIFIFWYYVLGVVVGFGKSLRVGTRRRRNVPQYDFTTLDATWKYLLAAEFNLVTTYVVHRDHDLDAASGNPLEPSLIGDTVFNDCEVKMDISTPTEP